MVHFDEFYELDFPARAIIDIHDSNPTVCESHAGKRKFPDLVEWQDNLISQSGNLDDIRFVSDRIYLKSEPENVKIFLKRTIFFRQLLEFFEKVFVIEKGNHAYSWTVLTE